MYQDLINTTVLVRSAQAGVYFGTLTQVEGDTVRLTDVRNIWCWKGATCLSQVAQDGITGGNVSQSVPSMVILGVCQIIPLSDKAEENLKGQPIWKA